MRSLLIIFSLAFLFLTDQANAQESMSPDKVISHIRDNTESVALNIPGWLIRWAVKLADNDISSKDRQMLHDLTNDIKKVRFVASEEVPENMAGLLTGLRNYMMDHEYEPLFEVKDDGTTLHMWAQFKGDIVKRIVISVMEPDDAAAVFNIKTNLDFNELKQKPFYRELQEKQASQTSL